MSDDFTGLVERLIRDAAAYKMTGNGDLQRVRDGRAAAQALIACGLAVQDQTDRIAALETALAAATARADAA